MCEDGATAALAAGLSGTAPPAWQAQQLQLLLCLDCRRSPAVGCASCSTLLVCGKAEAPPSAVSKAAGAAVGFPHTPCRSCKAVRKAMLLYCDVVLRTCRE